MMEQEKQHRMLGGEPDEFFGGFPRLTLEDFKRFNQDRIHRYLQPDPLSGIDFDNPFAAKPVPDAAKPVPDAAKPVPNATKPVKRSRPKRGRPARTKKPPKK